MNEKKQIGLKIWKLFLKKYSYGEIAKELGISKSVVSNVINYCQPPNENNIQEDIKRLKQEQEQELIKCKETCEKEINNYKQEINQLKNKNNKLKEEIKELEENLEELEEEFEFNELKTNIISSTISFMITFLIIFITMKFYSNLLFQQNFVKLAIFLLIISILVLIISFFATNLIKRFI